MLRVVIRHVNDEEGYILGDFPPAEVPDLIDLLDNIDLYVGEMVEDPVILSGTRQLVTTKSRAVLELLVE